jgi:hypothetical protein
MIENFDPSISFDFDSAVVFIAHFCTPTSVSAQEHATTDPRIGGPAARLVVDYTPL